MKEGVASCILSTISAIQYLFRIMDEEGPFEGIIGYSEGATVAGTLLLAEQRRQQYEGYEPMIKCAIFFAGWPPLDPQTFAMVLSDETDVMIDIHTCHISKRSLISVPSRLLLIRRLGSRFTGPICGWLLGTIQRLRARRRLHVRPRQGSHAAKRRSCYQRAG